ncbi:hypothetical protein M0812_18268 [Anaeramoeba flamelloides]|uniref:Uncharacterized protein n=1 Tax=Anaeramoeba flamelloides TaxID=1746091 RepID=A0AAV7Z5E4_9EUKA|nr:hypothetical protein M0812_18268 [Anaeramoeba flamelloides]
MIMNKRVTRLSRNRNQKTSSQKLYFEKKKRATHKDKHILIENKKKYSIEIIKRKRLRELLNKNFDQTINRQRVKRKNTEITSPQSQNTNLEKHNNEIMLEQKRKHHRENKRLKIKEKDKKNLFHIFSPNKSEQKEKSKQEEKQKTKRNKDSIYKILYNQNQKKTKELEGTVEKLKSELNEKKSEIQDKTKRINQSEDRISELENINHKNSGNNVSSVIQKDLHKIFKNNLAKIRDSIKKLKQETNYSYQEISEKIYIFYNYSVKIFHDKWMSYLESLNYQEIPKIRQFGFLQKNFLQWYMECHDKLYLEEEPKTKNILNFFELQKIKPIQQIYNEMKDGFGSEFLSNYFNPKENSFTKYLFWKKQLKALYESENKPLSIPIGKTETETNQTKVHQLNNNYEKKSIEIQKYFFWFKLFSDLYTIFWTSFGFRNHIITFEYTSQVLEQQKTKIINGELMGFDFKTQTFNPQYHKPLLKKQKIRNSEQVVVCIPLLYSIHSSKILKKAWVIKC